MEKGIEHERASIVMQRARGGDAISLKLYPNHLI
jgi:hypothetical protein